MTRRNGGKTVKKINIYIIVGLNKPFLIFFFHGDGLYIKYNHIYVTTYPPLPVFPAETAVKPLYC